MIKLKNIMSERFGDIMNQVGADDGDWVNISKSPIDNVAKKDTELKQNLFHLVDDTYRTELKQPNVSIKNINDVLGTSYDFWEAISIDDSPDADGVIFGKKLHGIKLSGLGHNGNPMLKSEILTQLKRLLDSGNYWIEASDKVAKRFLQLKINIYTDR